MSLRPRPPEREPSSFTLEVENQPRPASPSPPSPLAAKQRLGRGARLLLRSDLMPKFGSMFVLCTGCNPPPERKSAEQNRLGLGLGGEGVRMRSLERQQDERTPTTSNPFFSPPPRPPRPALACSPALVHHPGKGSKAQSVGVKARGFYARASTMTTEADTWGGNC